MSQQLKCLRCGSPLDQDFGIVACTHCGAVMMVDMDGELQLADQTSVSAIPEEPATQNETPAEPQEAAEFESIVPEEPAVQDAAPTFESAASEEADSFESAIPDESATEGESFAAAEEPVFENPDEVPAETAEAGGEPGVEEEVAAEAASEAEAGPAAPAEAAVSDDNWFDQHLDQPPPAKPEPEPSSFADVADFGNKDVDTGALQFELRIEGIDHADQRSELLEILADPRLYLGVRELPAQIHDGILTLSGLNAARTSLIVTKLQHLNLQISWRQQLYET